MPQDKADIEDPMAYMAFAVDGSESCAVYMTDGEAQAAADAWGWKVLPLYLAPRLTDAEREAVEFFSTMVWPKASQQCKARSATLRGLLERLSGGGDCPGADNAAKQDNTPTPPSTPSKCTVPPWWTDSAVNSREDVGK